MKKFSLTHVFITQGKKGASLYTVDRKFNSFAPKVKVIDTTGCGDAFTASIVNSLCKKVSNEKMLRNAVNLASKIATIKGAIPKSL